MTKPPKQRITFERTYQAPVEDVWGLWTTKEGFESWWGPEGFTVQVRKLELRVGGELQYAMIATGPEQIEFMKRAGMPLRQETRITFAEIVPQQRLTYTHAVDFVPGVVAYDVATTVEITPGAQGVKMVIRMDAMHDAVWSDRAEMGWESQLRKLDTMFPKRATAPHPESTPS
jgi:uncharacterized protein YndB with AHSA1/START domain